MKAYYVYMLTDRKNGILYTGITSNLIQRVHEHKKKVVKGFTQKYNLNKIVYFEQFETAEEAILYEKRLKRWNRDWKISLIEKDNPEWCDLYVSICR